MQGDQKSIMDHARTKEQGWSQAFNREDTPSPLKEDQCVVSTCPKCGSPIYAPYAVSPGEEPAVKRTCGCFKP